MMMSMTTMMVIMMIIRIMISVNDVGDVMATTTTIGGDYDDNKDNNFYISCG